MIAYENTCLVYVVYKKEKKTQYMFSIYMEDYFTYTYTEDII